MHNYEFPVNSKDLKEKIELLAEYLEVEIKCTSPIPSKCRYVPKENKDG